MSFCPSSHSVASTHSRESTATYCILHLIHQKNIHHTCAYVEVKIDLFVYTICLTNGLTSATATVAEVGDRVENFSDFLFFTKNEKKGKRIENLHKKGAFYLHTKPQQKA